MRLAQNTRASGATRVEYTAVDNAKLSISDKDSENTAVIVGNGAGGGITIVEQYKRMMSSTKHATSPIFAICAEQRPLVRLPAATRRSTTATFIKGFR